MSRWADMRLAIPSPEGALGLPLSVPHPIWYLSPCPRSTAEKPS